ncbi:MAG: AraC family transcriptional regulator [Planctomycetota bacterium]
MKLLAVHPLIHSFNRISLTDWSGAQTIRPHWRLYHNPTPGAEVSFEGKTCRLDRNVVLLMPPHTPFEQVLKRPCQTIFLHFSLGSPFDRIKGRFFAYPMEEGMRSALTPALDSIEMGGGAWGTIQVHAYLFSVLSKLQMEDWQPGVGEERIERLISLMEADPMGEWDNGRLASTISLSMNAMVRLFRTHAGIPPQRYLQQLRLDRACLLLLTTEYSIERIAEECRFCDRSHFSRLFKRRFRRGPASYRKGERR